MPPPRSNSGRHRRIQSDSSEHCSQDDQKAQGGWRKAISRRSRGAPLPEMGRPRVERDRRRNPKDSSTDQSTALPLGGTDGRNAQPSWLRVFSIPVNPAPELSPSKVYLGELWRAWMNGRALTRSAGKGNSGRSGARARGGGHFCLLFIPVSDNLRLERRVICANACL